MTQILLQFNKNKMYKSSTLLYKPRQLFQSLLSWFSWLFWSRNSSNSTSQSFFFLLSWSAIKSLIIPRCLLDKATSSQVVMYKENLIRYIHKPQFSSKAAYFLLPHIHRRSQGRGSNRHHRHRRHRLTYWLWTCTFYFEISQKDYFQCRHPHGG